MLLKKLHHQLVMQVPQWLRLPVSVIPFAIKKPAMVFMLQRIFKEALIDGDFEFLEGRFLKVSVDELKLSCFITLQQGQLVVLERSDVCDVSFAAGLNDLILIAGRKEDPDSLFFQRRLRIEGDTELGLEVKNLMDSIDLDELPKVVRLALNDLALFVQNGILPPEEATANVPAI
jgi:O2-independent ubiquinone biosynthesis accessory factor UbiT